MIAKNVEECWQIAFDYAEECQAEMNKIDEKLSDANFAERAGLFEDRKELKAKRDAASLIARKIKFGEKLHNEY